MLINSKKQTSNPLSYELGKKKKMSLVRGLLSDFHLLDKEIPYSVSDHVLVGVHQKTGKSPFQAHKVINGENKRHDQKWKFKLCIQNISFFISGVLLHGLSSFVAR